MESASPERLGRFEIVEELGRGAVGTVYLAQDPLLGRLLAVKTFAVEPGTARPDRNPWPPAPLREAQAAGLLNHPNIVSIHDLSEDPGGGPFIAMEYVRGTDLKEILKPQAPLPRDFILHVVCEVAAALDHAHSRGIVHGDIKPANLLIGNGEEVKVTDFGIARRFGRDRPDGKSLGTPSYASPEQIVGGPVDGRSDVFSLGVVLFEMLTGQRPFVGETSSEVMARIVREEPSSLLEASADASPELSAVVLTALAKDPNDRFQSAGELAQALRRAIDSTEPAAELGATQDLSELLAQVATGPLEIPDEHSSEPRSASVGRLPGKPRGPVSPRRLRLALALALLPGLILGALAWAGIYALGSGAGPVVQGHELRQRYIPLVREGRRLLRAGEPEAAARLFRRAESVAPQELAPKRLRQLAERQLADQEGYGERERRIDELLAEGRRLLELGMEQNARRQVEEVLALDPGHEAALEMAARIDQDGRERARAERSGGAVRPAEPATGAATRTPGSPPQSAAPGPPPTAVNRSARLKVDFFTQVSKGVLVIYAGSEQIARHPFRFVHRSGWLRRRPISGRIELLRQLPAGRTPLRFYLATDHKESTTLALETDLQAGRTTHLRLVAANSGELTAELN